MHGNSPGEEDLGSSQPAPPHPASTFFPNNQPFIPGTEPEEGEGTRQTWSLSSWSLEISSSLETPFKQVQTHNILSNWDES